MSALLDTPALDIAATRYLTLAAITVLIYDHGQYEVAEIKPIAKRFVQL